MSKKKIWKRVVATTAALNVMAISAIPAFAETTATSNVKLRILETTDIHVNLVNYDYYADKPTDEYGLAKTATLIKKARDEAQNSLLFDNGDLIQGNPLGDYVAKVSPLKDGEIHPVYKAMNLLNYDMGNIGNHEFNYGLDFLQQSLKGAKFPYVNANVYVDDKDKDESNDKNYFTPYRILNKEVVDSKGNKQTIKVGVIGFVPPQVTQWDKANLEGKVIVKDIVKTAQTFIPKMKAEGADLIVAIPHSGFEDIPQSEGMENSVLYLSKVSGIDAILFGHAHKVFPDKSFKGNTGVDLTKGTINGIPAVEPGFWGNNLGVIDLDLEQVDGKWKVADSKVEVRPIFDTANKKALVDADPSIVAAVKEDHDHTVDYVRGPVGETKAPINSFFALVQDDPSIQIVTNAQKWYVEKQLQGTDYEGVPVLSAGAPFKAGGRQGANYYTDIPAGTIAIKNVSDLYLYPNTVNAVLVTGAEVKEWIEWSAGQFNRIDSSKTTEQPLVNYDFPTYNYDVIDGVTYQIDVTEPAKYDAKGTVVNADASRVKNLQYDGKPIKADQKFVVATNNYRASSKFANPDGKRIILAAPDENRQAIIDYIREFKTINPSADGNWSLAPINGNVNVTFNTSPAAKSFGEKIDTLSYVGLTDDGYSKFKLVSEASTAPDASKTGKPSSTPAAVPVPTVPTMPKPATPTAQAPTVQAQGEIYTVKAGDNLTRIGKIYGITWQKLAEYNQLKNPNLIFINQEIRIPVQ